MGAVAPYIGTPRRGHAHGKLASSGERPSPGIGDHHPPNVDLLATYPRCARLGGRDRQMTVAHQPLPAAIGELVGMAAEQGGNFGLDGLRQQASSVSGSPNVPG
jgi:hypothetical protein